MKIHLLWTSEWGRPTNTEHQLRQIRLTHPELNNWQITRAESNAKALQSLLEGNSADKSLALSPFYNVHGKGVKDTMNMIAGNYTRLRLLHTSRLSVDYILAHSRWKSLQDMQYVITHTQAILQTKSGWHNRWLSWNLIKIGEDNTAAGLDFLRSNDPRKDSTIAISTPWQWRDGDSEFVEKIDHFGPENNHTYFGLFWLKDSDIWLPLTEKIENPENIQFGVIELDDNPWSLARALGSISAEGKNIHSIMSFPQAAWKVLFVIAYNEEVWTNESPSVAWNGSITETYSNNEITPYKYRLSIPNNRWSLGIALESISHLIDIRSIESIGTSRENADFEIIVAQQSNPSEEILSHLAAILSQIDFSSRYSQSSGRDYILHTLRN